MGLATSVKTLPQLAEMPDQLVAGIDRDHEALGGPAGPALVGRTRKASTSGRKVVNSGSAATTSAQASSGSSDSVAPAGPG